MAQEVVITCTDGTELAATLFPAAAPSTRVALLAPGTGIPRRYYSDYAAYLAANGIAALIWDWRGIAGSRPASLRNYPATMSDWATRDLPAVIDWACEHCADSVIGIGHSFGGQAFGLADRPARFERLLLVASQSGYWGHWPVPDKYVFRSAIAAMSLVTRLVGYLPAKAAGLGENLPKHVALEWFSWCRSPDYLGDYSGHRAIGAPVHSLGFTDDRLAPLAAREWLLERYGSTDKTLETIDPSDHALPGIGHLDYFSRKRAAALWPLMLDWLES